MSWAYDPPGSWAAGTTWFDGHINQWWTLYHDMAGRPVNFLELGSYEGRSTVWMLESLLTHPQSHITCVDPFVYFEVPVYVENEEKVVLDNMSRPIMASSGGQPLRSKLETSFDTNIARFVDKVTKVKGFSEDVLRTMPRVPTFDLVYIDGDHHGANVLEDIILVWPLVKVGGSVVFDDYGWGQGTLPNRVTPRPAIDAFYTVYGDRLKVTHAAYQVHVQKTSSVCAEPGCPQDNCQARAHKH